MSSSDDRKQPDGKKKQDPEPNLLNPPRSPSLLGPPSPGPDPDDVWEDALVRGAQAANRLRRYNLERKKKGLPEWEWEDWCKEHPEDGR